MTYEDPSVVSPEDRKKHFLQYDHKRLYGLDYTNRLINAGFVITEKNYLDEIEHTLRIRYALQQKELMYGYKKPFN